MRAVLILLLMLGGCGPPRQPTRAAETPVSGARIACAPAPEVPLVRACAIERARSADGETLTVRNPDGGFHRLLIVSGGRGVIAADGAERARVAVVGAGEIEVAIGTDRYRLPATVGRAR